MNTHPLFSILIPTWNNLPFLKLCIESIRKNSSYQHEILVHVNEGSDGTLEWVRSQGLKYTHSEQNIGVCYALNGLRPQVTADYMVFMNDDMYVCPEWDAALYDEIQKIGNKWYYFNSDGVMLTNSEDRQQVVFPVFNADSAPPLLLQERHSTGKLR